MAVERSLSGVTTRSRLGLLYFGIILIGANLRAPITSVGPVLSDIQAALHLDGAGGRRTQRLATSHLCPVIASRAVSRTSSFPGAGFNVGCRSHFARDAGALCAIARCNLDWHWGVECRHCVRKRTSAGAGEARIPHQGGRPDRALCGIDGRDGRRGGGHRRTHHPCGGARLAMGSRLLGLAGGHHTGCLAASMDSTLACSFGNGHQDQGRRFTLEAPDWMAGVAVLRASFVGLLLDR